MPYLRLLAYIAAGDSISAEYVYRGFMEVDLRLELEFFKGIDFF